MEERGAKNLLAALASGGGALRAEPSLAAAATFVAEVLVVEFFFRLVVLFLAARTSCAALSNSLVPPTIAAYDCVSSLSGGWGGPLVEGAGEAGTAEVRGRDVLRWGRCRDLCGWEVCHPI